MQAAEPPTYLTEWHVAFGDWGTNIWWHHFCRPGFRHVLAFAYDPRGKVWIVFDVAFEALLLRTMPAEGISAFARDLVAAGGKILRCKVEAKGRPRPRLFATCVTVIGHLLGLPRCAVFPYGLYRMLRARGATPAFEQSLANDRARIHGAGCQPAG